MLNLRKTNLIANHNSHSVDKIGYPQEVSKRSCSLSTVVIVILVPPNIWVSGPKSIRTYGIKVMTVIPGTRSLLKLVQTESEGARLSSCSEQRSTQRQSISQS